MNAIVELAKGVTWGGDTAWPIPPHGNRAIRRGDVCAAFHWIGDEAAMVLYLYPRYMAFSVAKIVPYALPLSAAHELIAEGGKGEISTPVLLEKAATAASLFGRAGDYHTIRQIADLMLTGLDYLLKMPPKPKHLEERDRGGKDGELAVISEGKTIFEGHA